MTNLKSKIEWTDSTWNVVTGCTKVSPGCDKCYAERITERFHGKGSFAEIQLHPDRLDAPLRWRKPRRVFVNSMSDLFHKDIPDEFIARVWAVMAATPQHTYQILTKRHGRMRSLLSDPDWDFQFAIGAWRARNGETSEPEPGDTSWGWPLPNVWLGVSVEDQRTAELRIPALEGTPAAVRFLSCEPLLSAVDLVGSGTKQTYWLTGRPSWGAEEATRTGLTMQPLEIGPRIDWVICGGESGRGARPMHPDWARQLRDQCQAAGVAFHFKQHGAWMPVPDADDWSNRRDRDHLVRADGYHWPLSQPHGAADGTEVLMRRVGKTAAGRELDGRTWDEFPVVTQ